MKKQVIFIVASILIYSSVTKADTLYEGISEHNRGNHTYTLNLLRPMAESGDATAQGLLGQMYLRGEGVKRNYKQALKWCTLAANQGNINAQANLGLMYGHGKGVSQDYHKALKWYRLAAEL